MDNYIRKAKVINVVDGDTIDAIVDLGYSMTTVQRFRLIGIDTPERNEEGYLEATQFVREAVLDREVYIKSLKSDSFGRYLAEVFVEDDDCNYCLNELLLEKGFAKVYDK